MMGSVTKITPFINKSVLKFHINLPKDIYDQASPNFRHVRVKGRLIEFSRKKITEFLESEDYQGVPTHPLQLN